MNYFLTFKSSIASGFALKKSSKYCFLTAVFMLFTGCSTLELNRVDGQKVLFQFAPQDETANSNVASSASHGKHVKKTKKVSSKSAKATKRKYALNSKVATSKKLSWSTEDVEWQLSKSTEFLGKACGLSTPTIQIDKNDYTMQVWLYVENGKLLVNTSSDIDIANSKSGIQIQNGQLIPFSGKPFLNSALWSGDIVQTMRKNDAIKLILRNKDLDRKTHEVAIDLAHLKHSYTQYRKCSQSSVYASL